MLAVDQRQDVLAKPTILLITVFFALSTFAPVLDDPVSIDWTGTSLLKAGVESVYRGLESAYRGLESAMLE